MRYPERARRCGHADRGAEARQSNDHLGCTPPRRLLRVRDSAAHRRGETVARVGRATSRRRRSGAVRLRIATAGCSRQSFRTWAAAVATNKPIGVVARSSQSSALHRANVSVPFFSMRARSRSTMPAIVFATTAPSSCFEGPCPRCRRCPHLPIHSQRPSAPSSSLSLDSTPAGALSASPTAPPPPGVRVFPPFQSPMSSFTRTVFAADATCSKSAARPHHSFISKTSPPRWWYPSVRVRRRSMGPRRRSR